MSLVDGQSQQIGGVRFSRPGSGQVLLGLSGLDLVGLSLGGLFGLIVGIGLGQGVPSVVSFVLSPLVGVGLSRIRAFGQPIPVAVFRYARLPIERSLRRKGSPAVVGVWQHGQRSVPSFGYQVIESGRGTQIVSNFRREARVLSVKANPVWALSFDDKVTQARLWAQAFAEISTQSPSETSMVLRSDVVSDAGDAPQRDLAALAHFRELESMIRSGGFRVDSTISVSVNRSSKTRRRSASKLDGIASALAIQLNSSSSQRLVEYSTQAELQHMSENWLLGDARWSRERLSLVDTHSTSTDPHKIRVMEFWDRLVLNDIKIGCLFVKEWPSGELTPGFMEALLAPTAPRRTVTVEFRPVRPDVARRRTRRKVADAIAQGELRRRTGYVADAADTQLMGDSLRIERELAGGEALFGFGCTVVVYCRTSVELDAAVRDCVSMASACGIHLERAFGRQLETLIASFVTGGSIR